MIAYTAVTVEATIAYDTDDYTHPDYDNSEHEAQQAFLETLQAKGLYHAQIVKAMVDRDGAPVKS